MYAIVLDDALAIYAAVKTSTKEPLFIKNLRPKIMGIGKRGRCYMGLMYCRKETEELGLPSSRSNAFDLLDCPIRKLNSIT